MLKYVLGFPPPPYFPLLALDRERERKSERERERGKIEKKRKVKGRALPGCDS